MANPTTQGRQATTVRLSRDLTLLDATMLGVGALVGGGIFVLPGLAAALAGPGLFLALALNALVTIPTLLVYAELSSGFHDAGGGYLWVREALGEPWGFLGGWLSWFSHSVACAVYSLASAAYLVWLLDRYHALPASIDAELAVKLLALGITVFFVLLNHRGVKQAARAENLVTTVVLVTLAVFIVFGIHAILQRPQGLSQLHLFDPAQLLPNGLVGIVMAMGLTFIAFEGYEIVAQASEEVRRPERTVPVAIILSVAIVAPLVVLVGFISIAAATAPAGVEAWVWLAGHGELALVAVADQIVPLGAGALVVVAGAMLSNITGLNSTIYSSSRVSFAMGRDRVLPAAFGRVHPVRATPSTSILLSGLIIILFAAALPLRDVAAAADVMFLLLFLLVNMSYIKLRRTHSGAFTFRAPLFPWLPLAGIVLQIVLAAALYLVSPVAWGAAVVWIAGGLAVHYGYSRRVAVPSPIPQISKAFEARKSERRPFRILLPIVNPERIPFLAAVARDLARAKHGEVALITVVPVPWTTPPSAVIDLAEPRRPFLEEAAARFPPDVPVHSVIKIAHDPAAAIIETAEEEGSNLILMGWRGRATLREHVLGATLDPVVREAPCDVAVLKLGLQPEPGRVLVGARGKGRHAKLGAELAGGIARVHDLPLVAVTVVTPGTPPEAEARLAGVIADAGLGPWETEFQTIEAQNAEDGLVAATKPGDMLVLGASDLPAWKTHLFGTVPERIATRLGSAAVLLVKRQTPTRRLLNRFFSRVENALDYLRAD